MTTLTTNPLLRKATLGLLLSALLAIPGFVSAQTNKPAANPTDKKAATPAKPASDKADAAEKKPVAGPFHGRLAAVDKVAKTISVGKRTFQINGETIIKKAGKPATLEEGVVGEEVSGYQKPSADGKLVATKVTFGPKADAKSTEKTKK